ncbi:MAG: hypothetical protein WC551_13300, partial [Patescibacteria group bacterium]
TNGADGLAASIAVAWTSNGTPGSAASVTNVGDSNAAQFGFVIPVGETGAQGPAGTNGVDGTNGNDGAQGPAGPVTNQIVTYLGITYTITNDPSVTGDILKFDPTTSNAWFAAPETLWTTVSNTVVYTNSLYYPYQQFSSIVTQDAGGTATVNYAHGALVQIVPATNLTITFDNTDYPTNGVNRVGVEVWASTNPVAFVNGVISNVTAPTVSTSAWTSLFFRRVHTNLWYGRQ